MPARAGWRSPGSTDKPLRISNEPYAIPIYIFHFVGHGGVDPNIDGGYILLADDSGEGKKLPARQLAGLLHDTRPTYYSPC